MLGIKTLRRRKDKVIKLVGSELIASDIRFKLGWKASFLIMATLGYPYSLIFVFLMPCAVSLSTNVSQVSASKDKCHNMYTSNFYAGPNKKVEALLHEIKQELSEVREDIKSLKENKTTSKGW